MRARHIAFVLLAAMVMASISLWAGPSPQVAGQVSLTITMRDTLSFDPASFSAAPGESVSLTLNNAGVLDHTFTLFGQADANVPVSNFNALQDYYNMNSKLVDMNFGASQQDSTSFTAPTTEGTYTFVCMVSGHAAGGMHGTMQVAFTGTTITMADVLTFTPNALTAAPGESVDLHLINAGADDHTFTLFGQADAVVPVNDFSALQDYYNTNSKLVDINFAGGEQQSTTFTAPMEEGTYTLVCMIAGHSAGGMHGTLTVTSGAADGPATIDPLLIGIVVAVVVIVIAVAGVFILRRRS